MQRRAGSWCSIAVALVACTEPGERRCDDGTVCPAAMACAPAGAACVEPEQLEACATQPAGAACVWPGVGEGACRDGVCEIARCGDAVVDLDERCDDGNAADGDGCSRDCLSDERCGNGVRDRTEECDDGNAVDGDGCQPTCELPRCGDGWLDADLDERCDDGNTEDGDGCARDCSSDEQCGNGIRDGNEECDDGNTAQGDGCQPTCQLPTCGDGWLDPDLDERCDDGNSVDGDGCARDCSSDEQCGNGIRDLAEQCDDGNTAHGDGCQPTCQLPACGDGWIDVDLAEVCDAGAANALMPDAACRPTCVLPRCGDTVVDALEGEVCDDGNLISGDGCASDCGSTEECGNGVLDGGGRESCDDGDRESHDGCSSACQLEVPTWTEQSATLAGIRAAVAYDGHRGRLAFFGGQDGLSNYFDDTREWDGTSIVTRRPALSPPPGDWHVMTYDAARRLVVLFDRVARATWTWDGETWTPRAPATQPLPLWEPRITDDPARGQVLLTGDAGDGQRTYTWDGLDWTLAASEIGWRTGRVVTFDIARRQVVSFGGVVSGGASNELRGWDGTAWVTIATDAPRPAPGQYDLLMSETSGDLLLVGLGRTWTLSGTTWTDVTGPAQPLSPMVGGYDRAREMAVVFSNGTWRFIDGVWRQVVTPTPRVAAAAVYEPLRGRGLMFGGIAGRSLANLDASTWLWDGAGWSQASVAGPSARYAHAMAYDPDRDRVVLFGGSDAVGALDDTWEWDGSGWLPTTPLTAPSARLGAAMAFDPLTRRVLLFGGNDGDFRNDTWAWDGVAWEPIATTAAPSRRDYPMLATDTIAGEVVLFGGSDDPYSEFTDTWRWLGDTWERSLGSPPRGHLYSILVHDQRRDSIVVFGGKRKLGLWWSYNDLWERRGVDWVHAFPEDSPSPRHWHVGFYDAARNQTVMFGGGVMAYDLDTESVYIDPTRGRAWAYRYLSDGTEETCTGGDADGDGLVACADPDCSGLCAPLCPPGATCAGDEPRCGDGICQVLESGAGCGLCPQDCGGCPEQCGNFRCDSRENVASCPGDCTPP